MTSSCSTTVPISAANHLLSVTHTVKLFLTSVLLRVIIQAECQVVFPFLPLHPGTSLLLSWFPALCRHTCMSLPAVKSLQFKDRLHSTLTCSTGHSPGCLPFLNLHTLLPMNLSRVMLTPCGYLLPKSFVLNKVFTLSDLLPIVPASESKTLY